MSFASQLQAAKGDLTARQVAAAVSPLLSVRTVEDWLANRRGPPAWTHDWIISRVRESNLIRWIASYRAWTHDWIISRVRSQHYQHDCAAEFSKIKFPKRPRKAKGQNDSSAGTGANGSRLTGQ